MNNANSCIFDEYTLYDSERNVLEYVTQWDSGLSVLIESDIVSKWGTDGTYYFHFHNKCTKEALVVPAEWDDGALVAQIPNSLLKSPYNILLHIYNQNENISKTMANIRIPMRTRKKPSDYLYVENISSVSSADLDELKSKTQYITEDGSSIVDSDSLSVVSADEVKLGVVDDDENLKDIYNDWEKFLAGIRITEDSIELKAPNGNGIKISNDGTSFVGSTPYEGTIEMLGVTEDEITSSNLSEVDITEED